MRFQAEVWERAEIFGTHSVMNYKKADLFLSEYSFSSILFYNLNSNQKGHHEPLNRFDLGYWPSNTLKKFLWTEKVRPLGRIRFNKCKYYTIKS